MKHKPIFTVLLLVLILVLSSGAVLAQGSNPPAGSELLSKSAFLSPQMIGRNSEGITSNSSPNVTTTQLVNGSFEQGRSVGWTEYSTHGWSLVRSADYLPVTPHSGNWAAWLGGDDDERNGIYQTITIPNSAHVRLHYWIASAESCDTYDVGGVSLKESAYIIYPLIGWQLCSSNNTDGWKVLDLDLSAYSGRTLQLLVAASTNDVPYANSNLFIDDVYLYGTFADIPFGDWADSFVERLYNAGITGGCALTPLQYCPEAAVTRAQMAVFLEKGIHGSSYVPPAVGAGTDFGDVPTNYWAAAWIKELGAEGITGGCGNGNYCPETPVTRDQMAVFLLRSEHGASYSPPPIGDSTGFGDVPADHWAAAWIKQLVAEGITAGCGNGNYCPSFPVTRAQMAVFLVRTFNLP
jgi:hypothetical protein